MSTVFWEGDRINQQCGTRTAELGYIHHDKPRGKFVLRLSGQSLGLPPDPFSPGEEWDTREEAKENATSCAVAKLAHHIWMTDAERHTAERHTYVEIIVLLIDNPSLFQVSDDDRERCKEGVRAAPLDKLREFFQWIGTATTWTSLGVKLIEMFGG